VLGVFAAVYAERAALRALSEHGSAEPDPGLTFQGLVLVSDGSISRSSRDGTQRVNARSIQLSRGWFNRLN